jgi:CDP-4-dehydro-6-deoxyglucose reductase
MARRISVSRAARLVGIKRGSLQQKIRSGELKTFEGELLLSDLLHAYPSTTIEDTSMLDRVEQIMEQATFIVGEPNARSPGNAALASRVLAISGDLARQKHLLQNYDNFFATLKSKISKLSNSGLTQEQKLPTVLSFYQWCKDAIDDFENTEIQTSEPLTNETFLRIMTAQVTVLPSNHEFFIEGADTILEAGLRGGLALNYGCSNGNCGLCKTRVVSGEVKKMKQHDYVLTEAEKNLGYILSCCNTAMTDVVLEADEAEGVYDIPKQEIPIRIRKIEHPNDELMIISAKTPRTNRLRFLAGQQAYLSIDGIGSTNYSIASCPCDDMNLQFHIPDRSDDPVASHLNNHARTNDTITLLGPNGSFTLNENSPNSLVFIAQDYGFSPIKGLIEHAMALDSAENMYLYWIAGSSDGHYLHNLCRSWNDALDNFHYRQIVEDSSIDSSDRLFSSLLADHKEMQSLDYYLCTEQGLGVRIESFLAQNKVPDNQLKSVTQTFLTPGINQ